MCQVGESSKSAGSGKIGRKGIGFKSVFQITDRPVVLSPPFQFSFDTSKHGVFGYIVPSWVEDPPQDVPLRNHTLLHRLYPSQPGGAVPTTGTLLVCPKAARVRNLDLMRDLNFDGLSLAFLKNLEKITFVSSMPTPSSQAAASAAVAPAPASELTSREHRVERTLVFEHGGPDQEEVGLCSSVLQSMVVLSHRLFQCTIVEKAQAPKGVKTEERKHYRLHHYTVQKYRASADSAQGKGNPSAAAATTTISLAFPVTEDLSPLRSTDGELVFAYLYVGFRRVCFLLIFCLQKCLLFMHA